MLARSSEGAHRPAHEGQRACTWDNQQRRAEPAIVHSVDHAQPKAAARRVSPKGCLHLAGGARKCKRTRTDKVVRVQQTTTKRQSQEGKETGA